MTNRKPHKKSTLDPLGCFFLRRNMYIPSYDRYLELLRMLKNTNRIAKFTEVTSSTDEFVILRHDIEFDISKAFQMALIENSYGVKATYFVQIESDVYNPFSESNRDMLNEITRMGHSLGLHFRQRDDEMKNVADIARQLDVLKSEFPDSERIFSCHIPKRNSLYNRYRVEGAINAYSEPFFYRTNTPRFAPTRYITDSRWEWNYGEPSPQLFRDCPRIQLLIHPFRWSPKADEVNRTFAKLLSRRLCDIEYAFQTEDGVFEKF